MIRQLTRTTTKLLLRLAASFALLRFPLPDLGEKIKEGRVKKLYVREGDRIQEFGKLADVESDKQFTEITSPEQGVIKKLYYREDETCQVGDIFLEMETTAPEEPKQPQKSAEKPKPVETQTVKQDTVVHEEVLASATVKMWARQHKIDLKEVVGTGRKGRIFKQDIIHFIEARDKANEGKAWQGKSEHKSSKQVESSTITKVKMGSEEQQIQKLVNYSNSVPHLYYQETFDVTELQQIIGKTKGKEPKVSLLSLLIKTFSLALKQFPRINSTYKVTEPFNFKTHFSHNILFPIYRDNGLSFNTIHNADNLNIIQIENALKGLQKDSMSVENVSSATICVSHIGQLGAIALNPLIYGEVSCHASIGTLREIPAYESGRLIKRQVVQVTMGCDHRVLDGATVARFTSAWRDYSESPTLALLSMV